MRIAQVSTLSAPVAEHASGSVEAWLWLLTRELVRRGHEVTVFGTADSKVCDGAKLVGTQPGPYGRDNAIDDWQLCEWINMAKAVELSHEFDVLHSHAYLWGIPLSRLARAPMLHTTHIVPDDNTAKLWRAYPDAVVTAISHQQFSAYTDLKPRSVIHHGVDISCFPFTERPGDYVLFMGRFASVKGVRQALTIAKEAGVRLVLAGPENPYFREHIKPNVDGKQIEYAGFVRGAERAALLGGARALLYPIQYPESFGLVLVEAMLCGTPVAAIHLGAVPEIIDEGVTGCTAARTEDLAAALNRCFALDRATVRRVAEKRFSVEVMAAQYEHLYQQAASRAT